MGNNNFLQQIRIYIMVGSPLSRKSGSATGVSSPNTAKNIFHNVLTFASIITLKTLYSGTSITQTQMALGTWISQTLFVVASLRFEHNSASIA